MSPSFPTSLAPPFREPLGGQGPTRCRCFGPTFPCHRLYPNPLLSFHPAGTHFMDVLPLAGN